MLPAAGRLRKRESTPSQSIPKRRGRGYGWHCGAMLTVADDADTPVFLEVRTDNDTAISSVYRAKRLHHGGHPRLLSAVRCRCVHHDPRARTETLRPEEDPR